MDEDTVKLAMKNVKRLFEESEKSLDELGLLMNYPKGTARKSAWQFLNKTTDPRFSMLCRFARAMGISVKDLF